MASRNLRICLPLLKTLPNIKDSRKRAAFLRLFEANLVRSLQEICFNVLQGNVPLTEEEKSSLKKYKKVLHVLASGKRSRVKRIIQSGRGFPALLPLLVTAVASAVL